MGRAWGTGEVQTGCWGGGDSLRGKERLKYLDVDGKILLNLILKKSDGSASTGLILLRTETTDGLL
jgi:hypothetical protein